MKVKYFLIGLMLLPIWAMAQVEGITYQAVIVDNNPDEIPGIDVPSNNIPNQELRLQFTIVDAFGNIEYQETQMTQTDAYGTINLTIGEGQSTGQGSASFNLINWDGPKTLQVGIDLQAGTNFTPFSQQALTYVPYVRHRNLIADGVTNLNNALFVNNGSSSQFSGDVLVQEQFTANANANFFGRVSIEAGTGVTNEEDIEAYPLLLSGNSQGMAIQLNRATPTRSDNFISFWNNNDEAIGRIEGYRAIANFTLEDVVDILLFAEPTQEEAEGQEDDDLAPPAEAPAALDVYATNTYNMELLIETIDLWEASATFGANLGACIAGVGLAGDCDDVVWSALSLYLQGVQLTYFVRYNETNVGVAFESGGADYAEWLKKYDSEETLSYGDIVGVRAGEISSKFIDADKFMVISKNPIVSGAMPKDGEKYLYKRVAFIGQVPVKVRGEVNKGDYILPSGNGDGMAIAIHPNQMRVNDYKRIIGVAWSEYHGNDLFSFINTAVGINSNDLSEQIVQMQSVLNQMQKALVQANSSYQPEYFDVETVSLSNNKKVTRSKTMQQLVMEQYGIDNSATTEEKLSQVSSSMLEEKINTDFFQFSELPYLKEVLQNPTPENVAQYTAYYTKSLKHLRSMLVPK